LKNRPPFTLNLGAKGDDAADLVIRVSEKDEDFKKTEFRSRISQLIAASQNRGLRQDDVGTTLLEVTRNAAENGLHVPGELSLLGKTLLQLDEVGKILAPRRSHHNKVPLPLPNKKVTFRRAQLTHDQPNPRALASDQNQDLV